MFRKILLLLFICFYNSYGQVNEFHPDCKEDAYDVTMNKPSEVFYGKLYEEGYNTYLFCAKKNNKVTISANFEGENNLRKTDVYSVESIDYTPYPFTGGTEITLPTTPDYASGLFSTPFDFCFFDKLFNSISVHGNGVVAFGHVPGYLWDPGQHNNTLPSNRRDLFNSIMFYKHSHWTNNPTPTDGKGSVNYQIIGNYPCRKLVINYFEMPSYRLRPAECNLIPANKQTAQIVLHETTNIIDINIERHDGCPLDLQYGASTIGINNADGTAAYWPSGMNNAVFDIEKKSFRFKPDGNKAYKKKWYINGRLVAQDVDAITVPLEDYENQLVECKFIPIVCDNKEGQAAIAQLLLKPEIKIEDFDFQKVIVCDKNQKNIDLSDYGQTLIDFQENPENYEVNYYRSEDDAINETNKVENFKNYPIVEGTQDVFVQIKSLRTECTEHFKMEIIKAPVEVLPKTDISQCSTYTFPVLTNDEFYLKMERLDEDGKVVTGMLGVPVENQQINEYGYYRVYVKKTNEYNCEDVKSYLVLVENCNYPKGISPNFDGDNDYLDLVYRNIIELKIYNRYGKVVYEHGKGYKREWMGQDNNGKPLPAGTYFLYVKTQNYEHSDWIQLVREVK